MGNKSAPKQKTNPMSIPSGHKSVGVSVPFVCGKKPAPARPPQNNGIAPKGSKKGMC